MKQRRKKEGECKYGREQTSNDCTKKEMFEQFDCTKRRIAL